MVGQHVVDAHKPVFCAVETSDGIVVRCGKAAPAIVGEVV